MNIVTKIKPLSAAMLLALGATGAEAVTLNITNSTTAGVNGVDFNYSCNTSNFTAGREFRMCNPTGNLAGGFPVQKDTASGDEVWTFDSAGVFTSTSGSPATAGINPALTAPYAGVSADPTGGTAMDDGAAFFGPNFSFLAPISGSNAAAAYGSGSIAVDTVNNLTYLDFPALEAQWGGVFFPLGQDGNVGIHFSGPISSIVKNDGGSGNTSFDFSISGEHTITAAEDPNAAGFADWSPEWYYVGNGTAVDSLFASMSSPTGGTIVPRAGGPSVGNSYNDGRITLSESVAFFGADGVVVKPCFGGCFDLTVTGVAVSASIVLPVSQIMPNNSTYRVHDGGAWVDFDTSAGDTFESGLGTGDPINCSGAGYSLGLTAGDTCVRVTIADNGPNDQDPATGTVSHTGGVAENPTGMAPIFRAFSIPGEELSSGCTLASGPVAANKRADWWLLAAFLGLLGLRRKLKLQRLD